MAMALANGGTMTAVSVVAMAAGAGVGVAAQGLLELLKQLGVVMFAATGGSSDSESEQPITDQRIAEGTRAFEESLEEISPQDMQSLMSADFDSCQRCVIQAAFAPERHGLGRVILYFRDRGHAVLGFGQNFNNMRVIDTSPFARVMGGTNIPLLEYISKMGSNYEIYDHGVTKMLINLAVSEARGR
jgi:hypothetical protein